jgi:DNA-binding SARP family transcriptional activator/ABC-type transporter Mla MlaB component
MEAHRYLRCLGLPALLSPSGEQIRFRTKKHVALLVYLAVEGRRFHHREHLAELLWPGVRGQEARHSLATALSILRPRIGNQALQTTREQVTLAPGHLTLDLDRLLGGDVLGSEVTSPLEVANFLDGFDIPDATEFAIWKDRQQARLLPAIKDALVLLIDRCRRTGDTRQIEQLADRMLGLDELSEEAIRAKMESRAFAGDRVGALKIFEGWKARLGAELGATPSELLERMAMRLRRRGWERTPITDIPSVPNDQLKARPFVGRATEYRVLYEAWEGLRTGLPAHSFVLGDSGVGKSTLVLRLTAAAALEGAVITRVQSYDLERDIPYSTLGGLVQGLLDRPGVSATPPEALAEIARTVPAVRRRFPGLPEIPDSQGETARIRLTEAFHQMLLTIVEEHPVILVVDDLHLADDASLAVLHLVMRRAKGQMIMVILVARPGELANSPQAARLRESAETLGIREVELAPLSPEESATLLAALVPPDQPQPGASARRALLRAAGGFPMVLELLTQDWQAHGEQSLALAVDAMTADLAGGTGPTAAYHHIITRIVRTLDHQTQNVLGLAAVLGHRLNDLTMYGLLDMSFGQTMAGLSELTSRRVLRDGSGGLEFVNELIRASAYTGVPSSLRRALHSSVVDRLLTDAHHRETASGLEIAWHCIRAGRDQEATPYLLSGAREAIRKGAPDVAEHALSSALPGLKEPEATEARFLLVEVLQEQGRWLDSLDMLKLLEDLGTNGRAEEHLVYMIMGRVNLGVSPAQEMVQQLPRLITLARCAERLSVRARAARALAYLVALGSNKAAAKSLIDVVASVPTEHLDEDSRGTLTLAKGLLLFHAGLTSESLAEVSAGIKTLKALGAANAVMAQLHIGIGAIHSRNGAYEEALTASKHGFNIAVRLGNDSLILALIGNIVMYCSRLGTYEEVSRWLTLMPRDRTPEFAGLMDLQLAYHSALNETIHGRTTRADEAVAALELRMRGEIPKWMHQLWHLSKADLLWISNRRSEAIRVALQEFRDSAGELLSPAFAGAFARWVAVTHKSVGEPKNAPTILESLLGKLDTFDALDQVEILCAVRYASLKSGSHAQLEAELEKRLTRLPMGVTAHLKRLEILA